MDKEKLGEITYENLCKAFELMEFTFHKNDEKLSVSCVCSGDSLRINVFIRVNPGSYCVTFYSPMPFAIKKDMAGEVCLALACINNKLKFGKFDLDIDTGGIDYNFCNYYYHDAPPAPELLKDMIIIALHTVDKYNDKLLGVNDGLLTFKDFINASDDDDLS